MTQILIRFIPYGLKITKTNGICQRLTIKRVRQTVGVGNLKTCNFLHGLKIGQKQKWENKSGTISKQKLIQKATCLYNRLLFNGGEIIYGNKA